MEKLLKGKEVADKINEELLRRIPALYESGIVPTLAIVRVGDNPSDIAYENGAVKKAKSLGLATEKYICPQDIETGDLVAVIDAINGNRNIHGILLLQPLPAHIDGERVRNSLAPEKDLDCISDRALGNLFAGVQGFAPCTAEGCMEVLQHYQIDLQGKKAVVIGRSMVIGKPVALLLLEKNATVTICHTKTKKEDLLRYCREADILVAAAGHIRTVTEDMVREGQTVIDVGINFDEEGKMQGDVDFAPVSELVGCITPVPGGVGSVTTSILMRHLVEAAERQKSKMNKYLY